MTLSKGRTYQVWRRSDGYVAATVGKPGKPVRNDNDDFEVLLETRDWVEARDCIESNRDARHDAVVASWEAMSRLVTAIEAALSQREGHVSPYRLATDVAELFDDMSGFCGLDGLYRLKAEHRA